MMTPSTKALLLGLAVAMTPALRGEETSTPVDVAAPAETTKLLDASFDSIAKVIEESQQKVTEAEAQRALAVEELDARRKAHAETQRELAGLKKQLAATTKSEAHWKGQSQKLTKKLAAGEEAHANLAKFRDQMANTLKEFSSLQGDIAHVRGELEAPAERVALRKQNAKLRTTKAKLEKQLHESRHQLATERKHHGETRELLTTTQRQKVILGNALVKSNKGAEALSAQVEALEFDLITSESVSQKANRNAAVLEKLASRLQHEHSNMSKSLMAANASRKEAHDNLAGVKADRRAAEEKLNVLGNKLQTTNAGLNTLRREKGELQQTTEKQTTSLNSVRKQLETIKADTAKQHQRSTEEFAAVSKKHQQAEKQIASLREEADRQREALGKKEQVSNKELEKLRKELKESKTALTALQNDTSELRKISGLTSERLKRTKQQIKAMEEEKQTLKEALKKRESEISQLQANLDKVHAKETAQNEEAEQ